MAKFKVMIALVAALTCTGCRAWQASKKVVAGSMTSMLSSRATLTQSSFREVGIVAQPKQEGSGLPVRPARTSPMRVVRYREAITSFETGCGCRIDRQGKVSS